MDKIIAVNGNDRSFTRNRYILAFGAYGWTRLMVWANNCNDAFDEAVDWIADNAPGLLADEQVQEAFRDLKEEGGQMLLPFESDEMLWQEATQDTCVGGNEGHYIVSHEWFVLVTNPSRKTILALQAEAA